MSKNTQGMDCLDLPNTQFGDLPEIIAFNISNLLSDDKKYQPHPQSVISAAKLATKVTLNGSDAPNLLTQARAILLRVPVSTHMSEGGEFDIVDIVKRQYPKGLMRTKIQNGIDTHKTYGSVEFLEPAFHNIGRFSPEEVSMLVMEFEREIQGLHLAELIIYSDQFKIDSILQGLSKMPFFEKILRKRINSYMESQLIKMIKMRSGSVDELRHVETFSLPLGLSARVAACQKFYREYCGGKIAEKGVSSAGSSSGEITLYSSLADNFTSTISDFYQLYGHMR